MERREMEQFAEQLADKLDGKIERKIDEKLKDKKGKNGKNGTITQIFIGVAILILGSFGGSYLSTMTGQKIDREKIRNNEANLERLREETNDKFNDVKTSLNKIEEDQLDQWKYIIEFANTRGGETSSLKKKSIREEGS
jgi:NTP pyrophosphatase (non-canonical NTP hydrolase)